MSGRFVIRKTGAGHYFFVLLGAGGEPLMSSESYRSKDDVRHAIENVIAMIAGTATIEDDTGDAPMELGSALPDLA